VTIPRLTHMRRWQHPAPPVLAAARARSSSRPVRSTSGGKYLPRRSHGQTGVPHTLGIICAQSLQVTSTTGPGNRTLFAASAALWQTLHWPLWSLVRGWKKNPETGFRTLHLVHLRWQHVHCLPAWPSLAMAALHGSQCAVLRIVDGYSFAIIRASMVAS
jgi:hypothetical protein